MSKLLQQIYNLKNQRAAHLKTAQDALDAKDMTAYKTALDAATRMNDEIEAAQSLYNEAHRFDGSSAPGGIQPQQAQEPAQVTDMRASNEYARAFAYALRNSVTPAKAGGDERVKVLMDALTEIGGDPEGSDGGFLVPVDLQTQINEVVRNRMPLTELFTTETTRTRTGFRVYDTAPTKGFTKVDEMATIPQDDKPKFTRINYAIEDYAMILPVSNDLLADETASLFGYLARWFGEKEVLTENLALLAMIKGLTAVDLKAGEEIKGLKTALNVGLKANYAPTAVIITNQDGFNVYDNLVDTMGRPLLGADMRDPMIDRWRGRNRIVTLSNDILPSVDGKAPLFIGDFKQFGSLIRRQPMEFASTTIGGNAWGTNSTEVRGILRFDTIKTDNNAAIARTVALEATV